MFVYSGKRVPIWIIADHRRFIIYKRRFIYIKKKLAKYNILIFLIFHLLQFVKWKVLIQFCQIYLSDMLLFFSNVVSVSYNCLFLLYLIIRIWYFEFFLFFWMLNFWIIFENPLEDKVVFKKICSYLFTQDEEVTFWTTVPPRHEVSVKD